MTTHPSFPPPPLEQLSEPMRRVVRAGIFLLLLMCGVGIFVFGSNYFTLFPTNGNIAYNAILCILFLAAAVMMKRDERLAKYWQIAFALFAASAVFLVTTLLAGVNRNVLDSLRLDPGTSQGMAIAKLCEALLVATTIIVLTLVSRAGPGALYLKYGNLTWGLLIGLGVLLNFATSALLFFAVRFTTLDRLGAAIVWGLVFSLSNAFMEELWFRGLFLKQLEPLFGLAGTILLTSIWFALAHVGAVYLTPQAIPVMLVNTFTLGVACAWVMMKTDSLVGATLIHAAADLFLFIAMLASV